MAWATRNSRAGDVRDLIPLLVQQTREFAMLLFDTEGTIVWLSPAAERVLGITLEEARGSKTSRIFTPEEAALGLDQTEMRTADAGTEADDDRWMQRQDGSRFWATGVMTALRDEHGTLLGYGKILRDRTDLREQMDHVRLQCDSAEERNRRQEVFLSTLAHELRNPLAPLTNAVEIIRMTAPSATELEPALQMIERQVGNLGRLVDDLLDRTRIDEGKIRLNRERLAIQDVVRRAVETALPSIRERRHALEVVFPPAPLFVEGDSGRLEQVFVNLLQNASKYTPEPGHIWVTGTTEGDEVVVHVHDDGIGIAPEMLPRIFDLFTQVESARERSQGLGLGLTIVKELVSLHRGSVTVRSEGVGKGSVFSVRLPFIAAARG